MSPGYLAAESVRSIDFNRDAQLSQRAHNDQLYAQRQIEKRYLDEYNTQREMDWMQGTSDARANLVGPAAAAAMPTKGIIPYANGASDIDTAEYLSLIHI